MGFGPLGTSCSPASNSLEAEDDDDDGVCIVLLLLECSFIADDGGDGDEADDGEE